MNNEAKEKKIELYMKLHYSIMAEQSFFYDKILQEADKILCVAASDLRKEVADGPTNQQQK